MTRAANKPVASSKPPFDQFYAANRAEWRAWLAKHHDTVPGIWLIDFKKSSGKQGLGYDEAVEEALCFGWIDSMIRPVDHADGCAVSTRVWRVRGNAMSRGARGAAVWGLALIVGCAGAGRQAPAIASGFTMGGNVNRPRITGPADNTMGDAPQAATSADEVGKFPAPDGTEPVVDTGTATVEAAPEEEWTSHGLATCAGKKRCPVESPVCVVDAAGARCVAVGSPGFRAVRGFQRHTCTRQGDCEGREGCFFVVGEANWAVSTHCIEHPGRNHRLKAVCDQETDVCDATDSTCLPCNPLDGDIAKHLPWMGFW